MATLAEINKTLIRVDDNTETTSKGINSFVSYLRDNKRKDLEAAREAKNAVTKNAQATAAAATNNAGKKPDGSKFLDTVRNVLTGATLARLAPALGKTLLKRVLGPAAIAFFAEDIVELLLPEGLDNPELKEALTGGLQGAALGFAIGGPLGAAIGGGIGALMTNEKFKNAVKELGTTLKEQAIVLYDKLEPTIVRFKDSFVGMFNALGITKEGVTEGLAKGLKFVGDAAASGIESLTKLIKGDFEPMDLVKGITTLGAVAALLMPGKFVKFLGLLAGKKGLLGLLTKGATALGLGSLLGSKGKPDVDTEEKGKTQQKPKPGSVVRSAAGNLVLAGADGKATAVKAPAGSKVGDMPKTSGMSKVPSKFGRMMKFLKIPGIAQLMAVTDAFFVLSSDMPLNEKIKRMGGIFGGLLGSGAGALIGGAIGMAFPPIAPLAALIGGAGGFIAGDYLGNKLANYLLGGSETESGSKKPTDATNQRRLRRSGSSAQTLSRPAMTENNNSEKLKNNVQYGRGSTGDRSGPTVITGGDDNSKIITTNSVSNTSVVDKSGVIDPADMYGFAGP